MLTVIYRLLQLEDPFREEAMGFLFQFGRGINLPAIIYSSGHLTVPSRPIIATSECKRDRDISTPPCIRQGR